MNRDRFPWANISHQIITLVVEAQLFLCNGFMGCGVGQRPTAIVQGPAGCSSPIDFYPCLLLTTRFANINPTVLPSILLTVLVGSGSGLGTAAVTIHDDAGV